MMTKVAIVLVAITVIAACFVGLFFNWLRSCEEYEEEVAAEALRSFNANYGPNGVADMRSAYVAGYRDGVERRGAE